MVHDPLVALETLISLGFERVLTSGCDSSALEGLSLIKRLTEQVSVHCATWVTVAASWALPGGSSFVLALISVRELPHGALGLNSRVHLCWILQSPTARTGWVALACCLGGER